MYLRGCFQNLEKIIIYRKSYKHYLNAVHEIYCTPEILEIIEPYRPFQYHQFELDLYCLILKFGNPLLLYLLVRLRRFFKYIVRRI